MTQPKALFLADVIHNDPCSAAHHDEAAFELRRLYAENESLRQIVQDFPPVEAELREVSDRAHWLEAQRDALLEALKGMLLHMGMDEDEWNKPTFDHARAAIKAVEGEHMSKTEALRLADRLEGRWALHPEMQEAAAELRRLHAENERIGPLAERVLELKAQRDALLEALRAMRVKYGQYACRVCDLADAAIKAVEEIGRSKE